MKLLHYKYVKLAAVCTILYSLLTVAMSYAISLLVVSDVRTLVTNVILVCLIYMVHSLSLYFQLKTAAKASTHLQRVLAEKGDVHFEKMDFSVYHQKNHGEHLLLYINDIPKVVELTLDKYLSRLNMGTMAVGSFIALLLIHYSMGFIALLAFFVMAWFPRLFQSQLSSYIAGLQGEKEIYTGKIRELLQGFTTFFENKALSFWRSLIR